MLKLKELREGNYVAFTGSVHSTTAGMIVLDPEVHQVDVVDLKSKFFREAIEKETLIGVMLTSAWLDRLSFEKKGTHYYRIPGLHNFELGFLQDNLGEYYNLVTVRLNEQGLRYGFPIRINCVHQLQNIYFDLTGKDLSL